MRAVLITAFREPMELAEVPDPTPAEDGVVLQVEATGVCHSDWYTWNGDEEIPGLPHVPGHEMAGRIVAVGAGVRRWRIGDRVTVPFSIGCGDCTSCRDGHLNVCDQGFTPGFTHWGSYAELVAIDHADRNLIPVPDGMESVHAAALGCRFVTAFRAVVDRAQLVAGEWLVVYGAGGVGLSAVMIGAALGGRVIAVDLGREKLTMAERLGAEVIIDGGDGDPAAKVVEVTGGGAHVSIDAVGSDRILGAALESLRKRGRHVQVGLLFGAAATPAVPMDRLIAREIAVMGSRGMPAVDYPRVLALVEAGRLEPSRLVTRTIPLSEVPAALSAIGSYAGVGMTVVDRFDS